MNEQNSTSENVNVEALNARVAELETINDKLTEAVKNLKDEIALLNKSLSYSYDANDKLKKALGSIGGIVSLMR